MLRKSLLNKVCTSAIIICSGCILRSRVSRLKHVWSASHLDGGHPEPGLSRPYGVGNPVSRPHVALGRAWGLDLGPQSHPPLSTPTLDRGSSTCQQGDLGRLPDLLVPRFPTWPQAWPQCEAPGSPVLSPWSARAAGLRAPRSSGSPEAPPVLQRHLAPAVLDGARPGDRGHARVLIAARVGPAALDSSLCFPFRRLTDANPSCRLSMNALRLEVHSYRVVTVRLLSCV